LRTRLLNATQGTAVVHHRYSGYKPMTGEVPHRPNGVYISMFTGRANAYSLNTLQDRADMFVTHNDEVYEGQVVGENARENDLAVNPTKEKKLTNMRASGSDENILLKPPRKMDLETALEYIEDDELVEVTPSSIRIRKMLLKENDRRKDNRKG
jgi:GTP-binding protein